MNMLDLTGKMVGITMTDEDLKSAIGLDPEFPLRKGGIYQLFGKVLGHAPVGVWMEVYWIGKPRPPGGIEPWRVSEEQPSYLVQWPWVLTMTLHPTDPSEAWLRRQIEGLGPDQADGLQERRS